MTIYGCLVAALLIAELKAARRAQYWLKPLAACGFLLIAILSGALDSRYGQIIFAGLLACAAGDVFLLARKSPRLFTAGMAAFAFGHFAYLSAFIPYQIETALMWMIPRNALVIFGGIAVYAWLRPHLPRDLRFVVPVYFFIILVMVINALGLPVERPLVLAMIGAVMFAISDIFVGRDRFVTPTPRNALAITPLYFGAQALIALSVQIS